MDRQAIADAIADLKIGMNRATVRDIDDKQRLVEVQLKLDVLEVVRKSKRKGTHEN